MIEFTKEETEAMLVEIERTRTRIALAAAASMPQYGPLSFDPIPATITTPRRSMLATIRRIISELRAHGGTVAVWE